MAMASETALKAAKALMEEHERKAPFWPFAAPFGVETVDDAYAVQRAYVGLQIEDRKTRPIGYKVGLTSKRMQAMCAIDSPIGGVVLADRMHVSGVRLDGANYGRFGLEFEIAARMGRDLRPGAAPVGFDDVASAVAAVCPAIEIVDDRHCDYATLNVLSLVADNSWNAGVVLGTFRDSWPDLAEIVGQVSTNGARVDQGKGSDVLGHPFHSIVWLANHLAASGETLRAGDIVMTGNMVTTKFPTETTDVRLDAGELGGVELQVRV